MADQRKVELLLGIRTEGAAAAAAGIDSISKVAAQLSGDLSSLQRADVLKDLGATAAQVASQTGQLEESVTRLSEELKTAGASEKEIRKVSQEFERTTLGIEKAVQAQERLGAAMAKDAEAAIASQERVRSAQEKSSAARAKDIEKQRASQERLGAQMAEDIEAELRAQTKLNEQRRLAATGATGVQKELAAIARSDQIQKIGAEMGLLAKKTKDTAAAAADLSKKLSGIGASQDEIRAASSAFSDAQSGQGATNRLARAGSELRALPSTQIPGLGIGTDAVGNFLRLGGALAGVSEKTAETSKVAQYLTPILGQTAAGFAGMAAQALPVVLILGAVALAVKNFSDATSQSVDEINSFAEAQRDIGQRIASGGTTKQAQEEIAALDLQRQQELKTLETLKKGYEEANAALLGESGDVFQRDFARLFSQDEQAFVDQIATGETNVASFTEKIASLQVAVDDGTFAANDAAEAEKKLAEERSKGALGAADTAAKELQAQQRALGATGEQNEKRLESIKDEKAVLEKQISVLESSGAASEEVTAKIAALKDSLGLLGKESTFISGTALEASRRADAEKQAKKDAEDAAKKAQQAQEQYTKSISTAKETYKQAVQDIGVRLSQTLTDNTTKLNRDLTDLNSKLARDEYDAQLKANRAELDAYDKQAADLADIRRDANKEEQEALRDGDFKALYLSRQKREEALQEQKAETDEARVNRQRDALYALEDLRRNNERQRTDRLMGYTRQNDDARLNQSRELQQAQVTRNRNLQAASQALNAELQLQSSYWKQRLQIEQQGLNQSLQNASGGGMTRLGVSTKGISMNAVGAFQQVIRK